MKNGKEGPMKGRQFVNDIRRGGVRTRGGENEGRTAFNHSV